MKTIILTTILGIALLIGGYFGYRVWDEERLLDGYARDKDKKEFVEYVRRDKKKLKERLERADRVSYTMDLGLQWYILEDNKRAIHWWLKGLDMNPKNEIGWYNVGNAYRRLREYEKAERAYLTSIEHARNGELNGCLALGELYRVDYFEKRDQEPAVYQTCLEKNANDRDLIARLGVFYRDKGEKAKALQYFDQLYRLEPTVELGEEIRKLQE